MLRGESAQSVLLSHHPRSRRRHRHHHRRHPRAAEPRPRPSCCGTRAGAHLDRDDAGAAACAGAVRRGRARSVRGSVRCRPRARRTRRAARPSVAHRSDSDSAPAAASPVASAPRCRHDDDACACADGARPARPAHRSRPGADRPSAGAAVGARHRADGRSAADRCAHQIDRNGVLHHRRHRADHAGCHHHVASRHRHRSGSPTRPAASRFASVRARTRSPGHHHRPHVSAALRESVRRSTAPVS